MSADRDPEGYYRILGVAVDATSEAIKSAFRERAKKIHPDTNRDPTAKAQFQQLNEAYETLGDPERRIEYDSRCYSTPKQQSNEEQPLDPVRCSHCGKITAQPRSAAFFRVTSFIVATTKSPIQGIFCSSCATKLSLRASLLSALFGWWGFPWGPIWTVGAICTNAMGGRQSQEVNERLIWYNAVAFLSQGKLAISYALAQLSRHASDLEISLKATKLIELLRTEGISADSPSLKNTWSKPWLPITHIGILLAIPGTIGLVIAYDSSKHRSPSPYFNQNYTSPKSQTSSNNTAIYPKSVPGNTSSAPTTKSAPTCAMMPDNGDILSREVISPQYAHSIQIKNGTAGNAIIKVRDSDSGAVKLSFFVRRGDVASFNGLPDGNYRIQYALGDKLGVDCRTFLNPDSAAQVPSIQIFRTERTSTQIITKAYSLTLYPVPHGNLRPEKIDLSAFNAQ